MLKEKLGFDRSKVRVPNKFISETNSLGTWEGWYSYKVTVHVGQEVASTLTAKTRSWSNCQQCYFARKQITVQSQIRNNNLLKIM